MMKNVYVQTKRRFSLIELLIVVAVLGVLASLMIPKMGDFSKAAKTTADAYNGTGIFRALEAFYSANGKYPSALHTGLSEDGSKLVQKVSDGKETGDAMTGMLLRNMRDATETIGTAADADKEVRESLKRAGIAFLSHGVNQWTIPTATAPLHAVSGEWFNAEGDSIRVRGQTIAQHALDYGSSDYYRIIPLFVTHHTIWDKTFIRNPTDSWSPENILPVNAAVGAHPTIAPGAKDGDFGYYLVLFFAYTKRTALVDGDVRPAEILTVLTAEGKPVSDRY